jgi:predicted PurR-regulated permease PerM
MARPRPDNFLTRERILVIVLVAVSCLVLWLSWLVVHPFVPALTWAVVLAVIAHPLHERLLTRVRWANVAAGLAVIGVTVVIAIPAAVLVREVGQEATASANAALRLVDGERWRHAIRQFPSLAPVLEWVEREVDVKDQVKQASGGITLGVRNVLANAIEFGVTLLITFFLLFFVLRDKWRILETIQGLVPLAHAETAQVTHKVRDMISAVVYGTLSVALVQGALGALIFWWLDLPAPLLWGAMMALMAVLPIFGAALIWAPAALFLVLDGHWEKALILVAWGSIVIGLIDNIMIPILMKNRVHMHTVPVFIAAMGGLLAFGATGIVLGPLVLAVLIALIDVWKRRMLLKEVVSGVNDDSPR